MIETNCLSSFHFLIFYRLFNNTKLHKEDKDTQSIMQRNQELKNQIQKQIG